MPTTIDGLAPNPKNPRTITDQKRAMLKAALDKFGDLGGVVFNRRSGVLVGGHQRVDAFKRTRAKATIHIERRHDKATRVGTVADGYVELDGERFAYREVDWPKDVEMAANLAANKGAGEFDMPAVADWMNALNGSSFDLDLTLFDEAERESLLEPENSNEGGGASEDAVPEPPIEPRTKFSDVYLLGPHRLMCGDSSSEHDIDVLMDDKEPDMVYTDPPYGMRLNADYSSMKNSDGRHVSLKESRAYAQVIGDDADFDPSLILRRFNRTKEVFIWGGDYFCQQLPKDGTWIVWDKRSKADGSVMGNFHGAHFELLWSKAKHQREIARILWMGLYQGPKEGPRVHPTQKPVALAEWSFERWGSAGDIVVDLYGGSGSTLLACEKQGRTCHMMEIDPGYCDVIIARWEKLTGQTAKLINREAEDE